MNMKRYIKEILKTSIDDFDSVVNLGAGFDTLVYSEVISPDCHVFEIDQHEITSRKRVFFKRYLGTIPANIKILDCDFDHNDLSEILLNNEYSMGYRTFFVLEGVIRYITEGSIISLLKFLSEAVRGSHWVFPYIRKDFIHGINTKGWEKAYKKYVKKKGLWITGFSESDMSSILNAYSWQIISDRSNGEIAEEYLRLTGQMFSTSPHERIVLAVKY